MDGRPPRSTRTWNETSMYVKLTSNQRSCGLGARNSLTMSGSPANFWPVWFQLLVRRMVANARTCQVTLDHRGVLDPSQLSHKKQREVEQQKQSPLDGSRAQPCHPERGRPVPEVLLLFHIAACKHHDAV
ncbi:hypothetical protein RF55_26249 [Lasius niger]|uniref:Uncharacterized protein n=1 Tax=Lasius niger TaxID=67767 RepID=A0A0J7JT37_LASNI|nr:hypothetical protein RF55_26249 [Lasius niger]